MGVTLDPALLAQIELKVLSGHYTSADEVVRKALALLDDREAKLRWLQAEIDKGVASLERGEYSTRSIEEIIVDARARHQARARQRTRKRA
jgi:putative addiction module CopG family antidote